MGTYNKGILGAFSGKVGPVVGASASFKISPLCCILQTYAQLCVYKIT